MSEEMFNDSPIIHLTKKDFELEFYRSGGKGGQNVNKVSSACRIYHRPSGCVATCDQERDQIQNRKIAFEKLVALPKFQLWLKTQHFIALGQMFSEEELNKRVEAMMVPENLKIEIKIKNKWVEVDMSTFIFDGV